jgi:3-oxoacyl-[acyl-carrier protein] reductase
MSHSDELQGKRIVITGSSRGLGRACALAAGAAGASVVINGTNAAALDETAAAMAAAGMSYVAVLGSVTDDDLAKKLVDTCVENFGGIDVVVNNAAIVRDRTLLKMSPEEFDDVIAVDLRGTWSVSRHAVRAMRDTGGLLLQISSAASFMGSVGQTNYSAAKGGVMGMLYAWDVELAQFGIRVNALSPAVATEMSQVVIDNHQQRARDEGRPIPSVREIGFAEPEEIAKLIVYLCGDRAQHIRSQLIQFDGRKLCLWRHPKVGPTERRENWELDDFDAQFPEPQESVARSRLGKE